MMRNEENGGFQVNRWRIVAWTVPVLVLLIPAIAMQFSEEVNWSAMDFVIFGALLFGAGLTHELAVKKRGSSNYKIGLGLAILAAFLLFWVNGAVGIIGNEGNAANLMYVGIIIIAMIGAFVVRFEARGMAVAMTVAAGAQVLAFLIALIAGWGFTGPITVFFVALWLGSAQLFRQSTRDESPAVDGVDG